MVEEMVGTATRVEHTAGRKRLSQVSASDGRFTAFRANRALEKCKDATVLVSPAGGGREAMYQGEPVTPVARAGMLVTPRPDER